MNMIVQPARFLPPGPPPPPPPPLWTHDYAPALEAAEAGTLLSAISPFAFHEADNWEITSVDNAKLDGSGNIAQDMGVSGSNDYAYGAWFEDRDYTDTLDYFEALFNAHGGDFYYEFPLFVRGRIDGGLFKGYAVWLFSSGGTATIAIYKETGDGEPLLASVEVDCGDTLRIGVMSTAVDGDVRIDVYVGGDYSAPALSHTDTSDIFTGGQSGLLGYGWMGTAVTIGSLRSAAPA